MSERMILPDEVYTQLALMLAEGERYQWKVGDYIEEIFSEVKKTQTDETERKIHADLVRDLAENTGADKSTLNDRHNMARFFSTFYREKYHMLTYSQLRACKSAGEEWETWASWSLVNGYNGKPAGVHTIRRAIERDGDPTPLWVRRLRRLEELVEKILNDQDIPYDTLTHLRGIQQILQDLREVA